MAPKYATNVDELELETVRLTDLRPHPRNYQVHTPEEIAHLKYSISTHGIYRNVVIAEDNTILAGHGVVQAATELGKTMLPVRRLPYAAESPEALQVLVGDNEMARLNYRNEDELARMLQDVQRGLPEGLLGTGYDEEGLRALRESLGIFDEATPTLDELGDQYGEPDDQTFWKTITLKVPPDVYTHYLDTLAAQEGTTDAERFAALLAQVMV